MKHIQMHPIKFRIPKKFSKYSINTFFKVLQYPRLLQIKQNKIIFKKLTRMIRIYFRSTKRICNICNNMNLVQSRYLKIKRNNNIQIIKDINFHPIKNKLKKKALIALDYLFVSFNDYVVSGFSNASFRISFERLIFFMLLALFIISRNNAFGFMFKNSGFKICIFTRGMKKFVGNNMYLVNRNIIPNNIIQINKVLPLHPTLYVKQNIKVQNTNIITIPEMDYKIISEKPLKKKIKEILDDLLLEHKDIISHKLLEKLSNLKPYDQVNVLKYLINSNQLLGGFPDEHLQFYYPDIIKFYVAIRFKLIGCSDWTAFVAAMTRHGYNKKGDIFGKIHPILLEIINCPKCPRAFNFCYPCLYNEQIVNGLASLNHGDQPRFTEKETNISRQNPTFLQNRDLENAPREQYASAFSKKLPISSEQLKDFYFPYFSNDFLEMSHLLAALFAGNSSEAGAQFAQKQMDKITEELENEIHE